MTNNSNYNPIEKMNGKSIKEIRPFNKKKDPVEQDYKINVIDINTFDETVFHKGIKVIF